MADADNDPGAPRFLGDDEQPPAARWEAGVVEVEFREGVQPRVQATDASAQPAIATPSDVDLSDINRVLRDYGLQQAEPTVLTAPDEAASAQATARDQGIEAPNLASFVTLHFPEDADVEEIARELNQLPEVAQAAPVPEALPPSDPLGEPLVGTGDTVVVDGSTGLQNQWYVFRCRVDEAWKLSRGNNVVVADIDWGYLTNHEDLAGNLVMSRAYNSYDGGTNVSHGSSIGHGTAVMGIAGAPVNKVGMAGFAPSADLWPIQANSGPGSALGGNAWARAIDWVRTTSSGGKRKVIVLEVQTATYGNYEMVGSVNAAIKTAIAAGVVVCVAAGNGNRDATLNDQGNKISPTGSILVGATAYHPSANNRAGFSNYGPTVVVAAPGDGSHDVTASHLGTDRYRNNFGGTSGATPKVAGVAALMLEADPSLTHAQIRDTINATGGNVTTDADKPVGTFLNAEAAVGHVAKRWMNNRKVLRLYATHDHKNAWAIISEVSGWRRINVAAPDGVTNVLAVLADALAHGRTVHVYADGTNIDRVQLV
jgi:subtilisin family serine protease